MCEARAQIKLTMADLCLQTITALDLPELAPYRTMRRPLEHERQGIFVAEGEKVDIWTKAMGGRGALGRRSMRRKTPRL